MDSGAAARKVLIDSINDLKSTIQDAQSAGVARETLANVVELATLRTHSLFESFLQDIFYLSILRDTSIPGNGAAVSVASRDEADLLLLSSGSRKEKYLSWLPLDRTLDLAGIYLLDGNVFERLRYRPVERRAMAELVKVRNVIAHPSDHAYQQFQELARSKSYPAGRAADYLLSTRSGVMEVLLIMTQVEVIANGLLASTDVDAGALLQPEADFSAQQRSPAGIYECARCATPKELAQPGKLGACASCEVVEACATCGHMPAAHTQWRRVI